MENCILLAGKMNLKGNETTQLMKKCCTEFSVFFSTRYIYNNSEREYKKETEICIIRYKCAECKREFPWAETQRGKVYPKAREPSYENKNQDVRGRIDGKNRE